MPTSYLSPFHVSPESEDDADGLALARGPDSGAPLGDGPVTNAARTFASHLSSVDAAARALSAASMRERSHTRTHRHLPSRWLRPVLCVAMPTAFAWFAVSTSLPLGGFTALASLGLAGLFGGAGYATGAVWRTTAVLMRAVLLVAVVAVTWAMLLAAWYLSLPLMTIASLTASLVCTACLAGLPQTTEQVLRKSRHAVAGAAGDRLRCLKAFDSASANLNHAHAHLRESLLKQAGLGR